MAITYSPIATYTSGSSFSNYTFTSIPNTYTDLILVGNFGTTSGSANIALQVGNGSIDTGSNYSFTYVNGNGSSAATGRASNSAQVFIDYSAYAGSSINATYIWQIENYKSTSVYKSILGRANTASVGTNATAGVWRSTLAIDQIKIDPQSTSFLANSRFTLYGIASA